MSQNLIKSLCKETCLLVAQHILQPHPLQEHLVVHQSSSCLILFFYLNYNELYSAINSLTTGAIDGSDKSTQASCRCLNVLAIWAFLEVFVVCIVGALYCCVFQPNPQSQVSLTRFLASHPQNHNSSTVHIVDKDGVVNHRNPAVHNVVRAAGLEAANIAAPRGIAGANLETKYQALS